MPSILPAISVVVPSHNRRDHVLALLETLTRQTLPADRFEVVVALDSVTDDSLAAISVRSWPFVLKTVLLDARNAGAARNAAVALTSAPRIVFIDDDVRPEPKCLEAHLAAGGDGPNRIVLGPYWPDIPRRGWYHDELRTWWDNFFLALAEPGRRFGYTDLLTGNVSMSRDLFDRLDGFYEVIVGSGREDYEFGYRALLANASFVYCGEAAATHRDESDPAKSLRRSRAEGIADVAIARRHPATFPFLIASGLTAPSASSWLLRQLTFRLPSFVGPLLTLLGSLLPPLERMGWRAPWLALSHWRRRLAYYSGVADAARTLHDLYELRTQAFWWTPDRLEIDLTDGIDMARAAIEAARPDECRIFVGSRQVGLLGAAPGLERLRRRHLDAWLLANASQWSVEVAASERLGPLPAGEPPVLPTGMSSVGELDIDGWTLRPVRRPLSFPLLLLVRTGEDVLGWLWLDSRMAADGIWPAVRRAFLGDRILCERFLRVRLAPIERIPARPPISVVVCTRDRTENLAECLGALLALDYVGHEIIVVDNAPQTDATARLVASHPGIIYVREDRPGLDWARNRGLATARHDIVAFTDDDTRADRHWLNGLARAYDDPSVWGVTGLVTPMELASGAQRYFEFVYGGMGRGFQGRRWSLAAMGSRFILWPSGCGVGANMSFRRSALDRIGHFNPALDVGTPTRGGGDIEMFHRVLAAGGEIQYTPQAFVWHRHRADWAGLAQQLTDNGSGSAAYLLTAWRERTGPRLPILHFALRDWMGGWLLKRLLRPGRHHRGLVLREIQGMLRGPALVRRARRQAAEMAGPRADDPEVAAFLPSSKPS